MTAMLSQAERTKLGKLLELLTRTTYSGERDAASLAARRILDGHRMSWADALCPPAAEAKPPELVPWRQTCAELLAHPALLSTWETNFLTGLPRFHHLSPKQQSVLDRIADRILGASR